MERWLSEKRKVENFTETKQKKKRNEQIFQQKSL